jgi:hypothetical protein
MAEKYTVKICIELAKEDEAKTKMWDSDNQYYNMDYEDVIGLQAALMGGASQLGMDALEQKKKKPQ